jgi:hypothetical protein
MPRIFLLLSLSVFFADCSSSTEVRCPPTVDVPCPTETIFFAYRCIIHEKSGECRMVYKVIYVAFIDNMEGELLAAFV